MTVELVRMLIPDPYLADSVTADGDSATKRFNLPYFPVRADSYTVYVNGVEKTETTDYTLNESTGVLAFVTAPTAGHQVRTEYEHSLLSDAAIEAFLTMHGGNAKLAAAESLGVIASSQVLILKVVRLLDTQVDGAAVSRELRQRQKVLRDEAMEDDVADSVAIAEVNYDAFAYRQILTNRYLRGGL